MTFLISPPQEADGKQGNAKLYRDEEECGFSVMLILLLFYYVSPYYVLYVFTISVFPVMCMFMQCMYVIFICRRKIVTD